MSSPYVWLPDPALVERANVTRLMRRCGYDVDPDDLDGVHAQARAFVRATQDDPAAFWDAALADMRVSWTTPYTTTLDTSRGPEWADWFVGGETNIVLNCIDRHAAGEHADALALIAETEDGEVRTFTFADAAREVARVANTLRACGVTRGDTVACYMPMVAEVVWAMLGTQKIGAIFIPIFS